VVPPVIGSGELVDRWVAGVGLDCDPGPDGVPREPVLFVDLSRPAHPLAARAARDSLTVLIGVGAGAAADHSAAGHDIPLRQALDLVCSDEDLTQVVVTAQRAPVAVVTLGRLLRQTSVLDLASALAAESAAYSTLLAGPERARLLPARESDPAHGSRVRVESGPDGLRLVLCRPERNNRVDAELRDELCAALQLARGMGTPVHLCAEGPDFSTGGDLAEFGSLPDPATAHVIRLARSAGWLMSRLRSTAVLQGRCLGSGIEIPAFCSHVSAQADLRAALPELSLGLVPGAGGTVSVTRRIGRWRTLLLCLTGRTIDAATALSWGLVDEIL
jgi:hypothetical protein